MAADLTKYFRVEAREIATGLTREILELEKGAGGKDRIAVLLRLAHTLKGAARVVKESAIADASHALEGALAPYREGGTVPEEKFRELRRLVDEIGARVANLERAGSESKGTAAAAEADAFETVRVEIEEVDRLLNQMIDASVKLSALGEEIVSVGKARSLVGSLMEHLDVRRGADVEKARSVADELDGVVRHAVRALATGLEQVERGFSEALERANQVRLLPASVLFASLEHSARDAARSLQRRISFETSGGEIRLEAHVLDSVRKAMLHGVRNAVAHGLESESDRAAAGKPAAGRVRFQVERRGNRVAFLCGDDGRGVDLEAVRRAAVRSGRMSVAEAEALRIEEVGSVLLKGGLTTAEETDQVSGRGIGLDAIRQIASGLKGEVRIRTTPGGGTTLELEVPTSLSSQSVLEVEAGGIPALIPLDAVSGTVRVTRDSILRSSGGESVLYEGTAIPFYPLARAWGAEGAGTSRAVLTVVVRSGDSRAAIGVDRLMGIATVVTRPLPAGAPATAVVCGASLDREGNPRPLIDPEGLVAAARASTVRRVEVAPDFRRPTILVIDDSLTTRMLERTILESAGYEVDAVASAEEALAKALKRKYDLFLVDVEMPGMDGFSFVARTRTEPSLQEIPSVLVTSRGSAEDKRRGVEVGARAYIVKGEFDQRVLLETIHSLVG